MNVFWFIPTHGDSRYLGTSQGARAADYDYFQQIAVAADTRAAGVASFARMTPTSTLIAVLV